MTKIFTAILSVLFLISCGDSPSELESTFNQIKKIEGEKDLLNSLDEESYRFIDGVLAMSKSNDVDSITIFSNEYPHPLSTQLLVRSAKFLRPGRPDMNQLDILYLVQIQDIGFLGKENKLKYFFKEIEQVNENEALVTAKCLVKSLPRKIYIGSAFKFSKEDSEWKLNLPSTFSYTEQMLGKIWRKWEGDESSFIQNIIDEGGVEVEFSAPVYH